jgi:hypothetical protein
MNALINISCFLLLLMFSSCATSLPKHFATNYYKTNEQAIVKIEKLSLALRYKSKIVN